MMPATTFQVIKEDLKKATCTEIKSCIRQVNLALGCELSMGGKKDELISRFANYITRLVTSNRSRMVNNIVQIINTAVPTKFHWNYDNHDIKIMKVARLNKHSSNEMRPITDELTFTPSPFFLPVTKLCTAKICSISSNIRQTKRFQFTLDENTRRLLTAMNEVDDRPLYQIRFYCAKFEGQSNNLQVEFPSICELKVNDTVLSGSKLRCLKGKPGTVNPPDITVLMHKKEINNIELVYINNSENFIACPFLVNRTTVSQLIDEMKDTHVSPKELVLEKLQQRQEEDEIIMESETLSIKDPLVFTRIVTPIRSKNCNHLQCFDATIYLTMNEQTPTWACPVCYKPIDIKDLIIDGYFTEILLNTPKHITSVSVEPNGHITIIDENPDLNEEEDDEEEEELMKKVEEKEVITITLDDDSEEEREEEAPKDIPTRQKRKRSLTDTPETPQKHQETAVIDLTIDSDEDEVVVVSSKSQENNTVSRHDTNHKDQGLILPHLGTLYHDHDRTILGENKHRTSVINVYKYT